MNLMSGEDGRIIRACFHMYLGFFILDVPLVLFDEWFL